MRRIIFPLLCIILLAACQEPRHAKPERLQVSENGRYLKTSVGRPFLYLGCTAWELFHRLDREEAAAYLANRKEKGFTVIQAVVLAENDGLRTPNAYGELPLIDFDPTKPNEKYFQHVDFIVNKAQELGLYVGMLPTWGDKVPNENPGAGPVVFTVQNARVYGAFLGKRYKDKPIIWIVGGDRSIHNDTVYRIWTAMAEGLRSGDEGSHLVTMHPRGQKSSSEWLHNADWLDFNMYQSGHARHFNNVYAYAEHDYLLNPAKPFVDGEPAYEDIPLRFWEYCDWTDSLRVPARVLDSNRLIADPSYFASGYFTDYDVRVHAYWNLLSGAAGYTYGNNAIWQMFKKGGEIAIPALYDWRASMDRPGADDIRHVRKLFEAYDFSTLIPDQSIIYGHNPHDSTHIRAAVASDRSFLLAYASVGQPVRVVMSKLAGTKLRAIWYDPREGKTEPIGTYDNKGFHTFTPPSSGLNNDWVLVLEEEASRARLAE